jgi:HEAT repeat protein
VRQEASFALRQIGARAAPQLRSALKHENKFVRLGALNALEGIKPVTKETVTSMIAALQDEEPDVRKEAAYGLGTFHDELAIPPLIKLIEKDDNEEVRVYCAIALSWFGKRAKTAVPVLYEGLKRRGAAEAGHYALALGGIGRDAVPSLVKAIEDPALSHLQADLAYSLLVMGPDAAEGTPALVGLLKSRDEYTLYIVAGALGQIGRKARSSLPNLKAALNDASAVNRIWIARAMFKIAADNPESVNVLIKEMKEDDCDLRNRAIEVLEEMGPKACKAVPALIVALKDRETAVRISAARTLAAIGPDARDAIPALEGMGQESGELGRAVERALEKIRKGKNP